MGRWSDEPIEWIVPRTKSQIDIVRAPNLSRENWLVHGFSTRSGGVSGVYQKADLNLGHTEHDTHENVERNRRLFMEGLRASDMTLVNVRQIHSDIVHCVTEAPT